MTSRLLNKKLRECSNCGFRSDSRYNSHRIYVGSERYYCGYMRVVREE